MAVVDNSSSVGDAVLLGFSPIMSLSAPVTSNVTTGLLALVLSMLTALTVMIPNYRFSRGLLDKNLTPDQKMAKFEHLMGMFVNDFMNYSQEVPVLLTILNRETIEKHKENLTAETYEKIMAMADNFTHPNYRRLFEYSTKELKEMDEVYKRK